MAQAVIVTIPKNEDGTPKHDLIRRKEGSEYGSIMLKTTQFAMSSTGILNKNSRSAYFRAKLDVLEGLVEAGLKEGADFNKLMADIGAPAVRIKRVESSEPAYEGHNQKMNPSTNELIFAADESPIYMQDVVAPATEADQLIAKDAPVATPAVVEEGQLS